MNKNNTNKKLRKVAYGILNDSHIFWGRKDDETIWVRTPGYRGQSYIEVMEFLNLNGLICIAYVYDSPTGQTIAYYKHRKDK